MDRMLYVAMTGAKETMRARLERREIGAKARGAHVGEIVVVDGLCAKGFLCAGHRHVEHAIHGLATCPVNGC